VYDDVLPVVDPAADELLVLEVGAADVALDPELDATAEPVAAVVV
jgi:hypothetical protein